MRFKSGFNPRNFEDEPDHSFSGMLEDNLKAYPGQVVEAAKRAGAGALDIAKHPIRSAGELAESVRGTDGEAAFRTARNLPFVGDAGMSIAKSSRALYDMAKGVHPDQIKAKEAKRAKELRTKDQKHAQDYPLADFVQRAVGFSGLPASVVAQSGALASHAFQESIDAGHSTKQALADATAAALLSAGPMLAARAAKKVPGAAVKHRANMEKFANERATKATMGGPNVAAQRQMTDTTLRNPGSLEVSDKKIQKIGQHLRDEPGLMGMFDRPESLAPKLTAVRQRVGKDIGSTSSGIDALNIPSLQKISGPVIADRIEELASKIPQVGSGPKQHAAMMKQAELFRSQGDIPMETAQGFKNKFQYSILDKSPVLSDKALTNGIKRIIKEEMQSFADRAAAHPEVPPHIQELARAYAGNRSKYGSFVKAENAATTASNNNKKNRFVSPSDYATGLALGAAPLISAVTTKGSSMPGAVAAQIALTGASALAHKQLRTRGPAIASKLAEIYGKTAVQTAINAGVQLEKFANTPFIKPIMHAASESPDKLSIALYLLSGEPGYPN